MPRGRAISVLSLAVWWAKLKRVRSNMTQIASLLVVAAVSTCTWLMVCILQSGGGGAYTRNYLCMLCSVPIRL